MYFLYLFYKKLKKQWPVALEQILAAGNQQPPMTLRVNIQLISRDAYLAQLAEAGIIASAGALSEQAILFFPYTQFFSEP